MVHADLIDDSRWLDIALIGGGQDTVGIRDALLRSHEATGLIVEVPTMIPAIWRQVLLPVVVDALGCPSNRSQWQQRFEQGQFTRSEIDTLNAYLDTWRHRFDLFDESAPFVQGAGIRTATGATKGSALLVATAPFGNNVPLFASRTEADPLPLDVGQAARWLLHAQCWDTAAIKTGVVDGLAKNGKTTGNPVSPLGQIGVSMPMGRTLYETLLLNLPICGPDRLGTPQWHRPAGPTWEIRDPEGLLDLWTWQSRRIRLFPEAIAEGVVVTQVIVAAGDRLANGTPEWEPHTAWRREGSTKSAAAKRKKDTNSPAALWRPLRHTAGRAIWRGMHAFLALESETTESFQTSDLINQLGALDAEKRIPDDYPLRMETFGMVYGTQSAVVDDLLHDVMPMPVAALRGTGDSYAVVLEVTSQAEQLALAINDLSADLRRAAGTDPIPWDKGQRPGEQLLYALDPLVRRLLAGVSAAGDDVDLLDRGQLAWEQLAYRVVRDTTAPLFAVPATAFLGRQAGAGDTKSSQGLGWAANKFSGRVNRILHRAAAARGGRNLEDHTDES